MLHLHAKKMARPPLLALSSFRASYMCLVVPFSIFLFSLAPAPSSLNCVNFPPFSPPFSAKLWSLPWSEEQGNHPDVELLAILDHDHPVRTGTLTADGGVVATATDTGDIYLWNTDDSSSPLSVLDEVGETPSLQRSNFSRVAHGDFFYAARIRFVLLGGRYVSEIELCHTPKSIMNISHRF